MSTKLLYVFGFLLIVVASYFYANNNATLTKLSLQKSDIDYQAKNIHALQTSDTGYVNYRLNASEVTHYQTARTGTLTNPTIEWVPNPTRKVTFQAVLGTLNETTQEVLFQNNVKMVSQPLLNDGSASVPMQLDAQQLTGNLLTKQVISTQPIQVTQGNNSFTANSLKADVNTGEYEFERVSMTFSPSQN